MCVCVCVCVCEERPDSHSMNKEAENAFTWVHEEVRCIEIYHTYMYIHVYTGIPRAQYFH